VNEHEVEPIRGLPERLPQGEHILWQGAPDWQSLAIRALHVRAVIAYFAILFVWSVWAAIMDGTALGAALFIAVRLVPVTLAAAGLLAGYAWLVHRTTVYTITNRRVVMRFGIALPMTLNLPFAIVGSAAVKAYGDKTGDIPLELTGTDCVSYLALWPHARPWRTAKPQPMLRSVPQAEQVSAILSEALRLAARSRTITSQRPVADEALTPEPQAA
jgi:hypothetical protein